MISSRYTVAQLVCTLLLASAILLSGCSSGPVMAEVEGTVVMKGGKPLDQIYVEFWPESDGPRSIGTTDSQGRFTLKSDDGKLSGAVVGKHKVVLRDASVIKKFLGRKAEGVDLSEGRKSRINKRYSDAATTPVKETVTGGKSSIKIELDP